MKVTINWLKDYVDINVNPYELSDRLVKAGFEIEEIINQADSIKNVVVGRIQSVAKHPEADKLSVCQVDVGSKVLQIVCGAKNAIAGLTVPVALIGAVLPDGKTIKEGAIRNVVSYGMMCGGSELGLSESDYAGAGYDGLLVLPSDLELGTDINAVIGNDDIILDVNVTANRPDCNSIIGIAREIAAVLETEIKQIPSDYRRAYDSIDKFLKVSVEACDLCPRYMAKVVKNVKVEPAPQIIRKRLKAVGIRSINNIVDITNYVLIEIGQPMHAFDIRQVEGNEIIVRRADSCESIVALDGNSYNLTSNHLVIADKAKPIALGGIMGGMNSGVMDDTTTIVLESARFNRENIRRSSRELNLRSDSSARFEKGIDYLSQEIALERALTLLGMGEVLNDTIDSLGEEIKKREIVFKPNDINAILGIEISADIMVNKLNLLSIESTIEGNSIISLIPAYREDIVGINDLAEEIIRLYGYDHILSDKLPPRGGKSEKQLIADRIKDIMVAEGMNEIVTYSFTSMKAYDMLMIKDNNPLRKAIKLMNALGEDFSIMRTTLAHSMLSIITSNYNKGNKEGRLFEVARVYHPEALPLTELPIEKEKLCLGIFGAEDYYSLKGIIDNLLSVANIDVKYSRANFEFLHPGKSANIIVKGNIIGCLGEVHPDVLDNYDLKTKAYIAEIDMDSLKDNWVKIKPFIPIPKFPAINRDLALVVDESISVGELIEYISSYDMLIKNTLLFDIYRGNQIEAGKKSVALTIEMRATERTLKLEETNMVIDKLLVDLKTKYNAKIRE